MTLVLIFSVLALTGCEKEHFNSDYAGIYGSRTIRDISGGFSGRGYKSDFDILQITNRMHYSLCRGQDTLVPNDGCCDMYLFLCQNPDLK